MRACMHSCVLACYLAYIFCFSLPCMPPLRCRCLLARLVPCSRVCWPDALALCYADQQPLNVPQVALAMSAAEDGRPIARTGASQHLEDSVTGWEIYQNRDKLHKASILLLRGIHPPSPLCNVNTGHPALVFSFTHGAACECLLGIVWMQYWYAWRCHPLPCHWHAG